MAIVACFQESDIRKITSVTHRNCFCGTKTSIFTRTCNDVTMMGREIARDPVLNGFYETPKIIRTKVVFFKKVFDGTAPPPNTGRH
jgi:hypothetical protein